MPIFKFRIYWETDDNIYRDVLIKSAQSFADFNQIIISAFEFKDNQPASFFESNDKWIPKREISSEVLVNKREAPALSMIKTPIGALVTNPDKKFVYIYKSIKDWTFLIDLISIIKEEDSTIDYPICIKTVGISPILTLTNGLPNDKMVEIEEKYDLNKEDMDEQGFGDENEDGEESFSQEDTESESDDF